MRRDEADMKARIQEEYRARAEAEARAKIEAEMKAQEEAAAAAAAAVAAAEEEAAAAENAAATATAKADADHHLEHDKIRANGTVSHGAGGGGAGSNSGSRGLRLTSPGGSSDGTEVNSLSARSSEAGGGKDNHHHHHHHNHDGPPFSGGRMLDVAEAEEMNAAIKQLYLKTPPSGSPFVLFKARLRTSRREWNIERRYSDFVWLHEVGVKKFNCCFVLYTFFFF